MREISVIWDTTKHCIWNCPFCAMAATSDRLCTEYELTNGEKLDVVLQLDELSREMNVRVDVSGGELLLDPFHLKVLKHLSGVLGQSNVGISTSGVFIDEQLAEFFARTVSDVEMTMDVAPSQHYCLRPKGYHETAARAVPLLKKSGVKVGIQTVVCRENCSEDDARAVFEWCCENFVDEWSILRFFPAGRGVKFPNLVLTDAECAGYVKRTREMVRSSKHTVKPKVDFHYSMPGSEKYTTECRCVKKSIGILPNGDVTACFWALDSCTGIVDPKYLLGNVRIQRLSDILNGERAHYWLDCPHTCEFCA